MLFHGQQLLRVTTRMSMASAGNYTILRAISRAPIPWDMEAASTIDIEKLKADMAEEVERTSGRDFSKRATGGANPDFYRNFINNGQDKRLTAEVFVGITKALGKDPADYVLDFDPALRLPSAAVLTSAFALLLESVGIDPFLGERAQMLADKFPSALRSVITLRADLAEDGGSSLSGSLHDHDVDQPTA